MLVGANLVATNPRRLPALERRETIVAAAISLFAERGFRGTTTKELARLSGVTEPVLYQHFATKRDLYSAIIEKKSREGDLMIESALGPYLNSGDDGGFFTALAGVILERRRNDPDFLRLLLFSALEGHELSDLFVERQLKKCYRIVSGYIRKRMRDGAFRLMDPVLAARAFLGMVHHHGMVTDLFNDPIVRVKEKKVIEEMVGIFLCGMMSERKHTSRRP